jgi:hypothetical protein
MSVVRNIDFCSNRRWAGTRAVRSEGAHSLHHQPQDIVAGRPWLERACARSCQSFYRDNVDCRTKAQFGARKQEEQMELNFMAMPVAEHILLLESQIEALKKAILSQPNAPTLERLDRELFNLQSQIQKGQRYRERFDEFRLVFESQTDSTALIRALYAEVLGRQSVS